MHLPDEGQGREGVPGLPWEEVRKEGKEKVIIEIPEWFLWVFTRFIGISASLTAVNIYLKIQLRRWRKR